MIPLHDDNPTTSPPLITFGVIACWSSSGSSVWVLGFWFAIQLLSGLAGAGRHGGVAFGAHVGGFLAGLALIPWFRHRNLPLYNPLRR